MLAVATLLIIILLFSLPLAIEDFMALPLQKILAVTKVLEPMEVKVIIRSIWGAKQINIEEPFKEPGGMLILWLADYMKEKGVLTKDTQIFVLQEFTDQLAAFDKELNAKYEESNSGPFSVFIMGIFDSIYACINNLDMALEISTGKYIPIKDGGLENYWEEEHRILNLTTIWIKRRKLLDSSSGLISARDEGLKISTR